MTIRDTRDNPKERARLLAILNSDQGKVALTEVQYRRLLKYMRGEDTLSIAQDEGVAREVVSMTIQRAIRNLHKFV